MKRPGVLLVQTFHHLEDLVGFVVDMGHVHAEDNVGSPLSREEKSLRQVISSKIGWPTYTEYFMGVPHRVSVLSDRLNIISRVDEAPEPVPLCLDQCEPVDLIQSAELKVSREREGRKGVGVPNQPLDVFIQFLNSFLH